MNTIEAAISVQDALYNQISQFAEEMQISENEVFILAVQEYLERHRKQKLFDSLNEAYDDGLEQSELELLEQMRQHQRTLMEQAE